MVAALAECRRGPSSRPVNRLSVLLLLALGHDVACADVTVRWLGFAGFTITSRGTGSGETTIAVDPYLSRPGFFSSFLRAYEPDERVLEIFLTEESPAPELSRASYYLVGHSHHDHLGDIPWLASRTGGLILGSATTDAIAKAYGHSDNIVIGPADGPRKAGAFDVLVFDSPHATLVGDWIPFEGEVTAPPDAPIHMWSFKLGGARGYLVVERETGTRIAVLSSAGCDQNNVDERFRPVDMLLAPVPMGRDDSYAHCLIAAFAPGVVIPHHFEDLFSSLASGNEQRPKHVKRLDAFERDLTTDGSCAPDVRRLPIYGTAIVSRRPACP